MNVELSNVPELLDYRVNIRIHDNIIACNAIVAMQENKNTQIQRNISKIFFRLYRIQRKYVHIYIHASSIHLTQIDANSTVC